MRETSMVRKLFITPWFGPLPEWWDKYKSQFDRMHDLGYDWFVTQDLDDFNARCKDVLGFESNIVPGTGKLHDFRCALGELYADKAAGYDFWGTTDFDCIYGDILIDKHLENLDIYSDEEDYVGGHFTLYRNTPAVNTAFVRCPEWKEHMLGPHSGWVEKEYTQTVNRLGLRIMYKKLENALIHFNRSKKWPLH